MTDHHSPDLPERDVHGTPAERDLPERDHPETPAAAEADREPGLEAPAAALESMDDHVEHASTVDDRIETSDLADRTSAQADPVETSEPADRTSAPANPVETTELTDAGANDISAAADDVDPEDPDLAVDGGADVDGGGDTDDTDDTDGSDTTSADDDGGGAEDWAPPPPPDASHDAPPPPLPAVRRLRRADASSGPGVAAGIARYFGVETGLVKAAFVVASFFGGLGIFVYIAAWALIPSERHPDPRPVVMNGSVAGIVIGTLAMVGAVSVAFGAGGAAGSLLAPALLIGIGFYLLDQRSTPQVMTNTSNQPPARPSWIPPLTTTPLSPEPPRAMGYADTSSSAMTPGDLSAGMSTPAWGTVLTEPAAPFLTAKPKPPITAVTMAITALVVATLIGLDQFTDVDVSVPQMFGAALGIIVFGIVVSLFVGRALGLWFAGLIALIGWAVSPIAVAITEDGVGSRQYRVVDGRDLEANYTLGTGELIVDLRDASFTSDAATQIDLHAGSIVVYLPDDATIDLRADARFGEVIAPIVSETGGVGTITDEVNGPGSEVRRVYEAREGAPTVRLDVDIRFGSIEIRR